jgi:hypothetical protein
MLTGHGGQHCCEPHRVLREVREDFGRTRLRVDMGSKQAEWCVDKLRVNVRERGLKREADVGRVCVEACGRRAGAGGGACGAGAEDAGEDGGEV